MVLLITNPFPTSPNTQNFPRVPYVPWKSVDRAASFYTQTLRCMQTCIRKTTCTQTKRSSTIMSYIYIHLQTDHVIHILSFTYTRIQLHTYISKSVYPIPERSVPMAGLLWALKKLYEEPPFGAGAPSKSLSWNPILVGLERLDYFDVYWECHNPNWLSLHHFSEG